MSDHANHATDSDHHGPAHLAHHFDNVEQQQESEKLGMWVFLGTEILMFGGLFCAYAIYRAHHFEIFEYCHWMLDWKLGALNTAVLLASSLTMALGVRAAQLGQKQMLVTMLLLTFLGGCGFMVIKGVEYTGKWSHGLWPGHWNAYYPIEAQEARIGELNSEIAETMKAEGNQAVPSDFLPMPTRASRLAQIQLIENYYFAKTLDVEWFEPHYIDPKFVHVHDGHVEVGPPAVPKEGEEETHHADHYPADLKPGTYASAYGPTTPPVSVPVELATPYAAFTQPTVARDTDPPAPVIGVVAPTTTAIPAPAAGPAGVVAEAMNIDLRPSLASLEKKHYTYETLPVGEQERVHMFFQIYYMMTGLHGVHVLIGMGLIGWITVRAFAGHFSPEYYAPVDIVGLYWHLVDLIWIFLFPLLYLIH